MKKLYTLTLIIMMFFTSNLFSQVTLPYTSTNNFDNPNWSYFVTTDYFFTVDSTFTTPAGIDSQNGHIDFSFNMDQINFQSVGNTANFVASSTLKINPSSTNIDYTIDYFWTSGSNRNCELLGSVDSVSFYTINPSVSTSSNLSFDNTITNYTFIRIKFTSTGTSNMTLLGFNISNITTSVDDINVKNNFSVYSHNKNLVVKSNDTKDYTITVYNLSGQVILSKTTRGNNNFKLDVANGMYLVKVNNGTESINQKIVIQ